VDPRDFNPGTHIKGKIEKTKTKGEKKIDVPYRGYCCIEAIHVTGEQGWGGKRIKSGL